jgi:hypothetical protein
MDLGSFRWAGQGQTGRKVIVFACALDKRDHGVRACREGDIAHAATESIVWVRRATSAPGELASPQPGVARVHACSTTLPP